MNLSDFVIIKKGEYLYEQDTSDSATNYLIKKRTITNIEYSDGYICFKSIGGERIKLRVTQEQLLNILNQLDMPELLI